MASTEQAIPLLTDEETHAEKLPETTHKRWSLRSLGSSLDLSSIISSAIAFLIILKPYLWSILPTFLRPGGFDFKPVTPTTYLDSLRGYAAWIVFNGHSLGYPQTWYFKLPGPHLFTAGAAMVDIFFVISGYVLSYRILILIRTRQSGKLVDTLAGSTFRRYLRLYGSTAIATFVTIVFIHLGWCRVNMRKDTWAEQIWDWVMDTWIAGDPFIEIEGWWYPDVFRTKFLDQMWTIPVEFRGSMVLFAFCTSAAKLRTRGRMVYTWIVICLCYYWQAMYACLFIYGLFIADLSLSLNPERLAMGSARVEIPRTRDADEEDPISGKTPRWLQTTTPKLRKYGPFFILFIAFILLNQPHDLGYEGYFPWPILSQLIPPCLTGDYMELQHFWLSIGAFLLVLALDLSPDILQKPFVWSFSRYMGKISFGIYAMHNTIIWSLWEAYLRPWSLKHWGQSNWAYIPGYLVTLFCVLCAADYFTRLDNLMVRLGRWMQGRGFQRWD